MNHIEHFSRFKNCYYVMRHGQSKANSAGVIVSQPVNGIKQEFALTELGAMQAKNAAQTSQLGSKTLIYCSDFSRARQTAEIVAHTIGAGEPVTTPLLRERDFGDWELTDHANYAETWKHDALSAEHTEASVESVNSVLARATQLVVELEQRHAQKDILLVSHGDTLQILQTAFEKVHPTKHRSLVHLETAEIRRVA